MNPQTRVWLTPAQVAETLQVEETTVREWLRKGSLRGTKVGRLWRIASDELDRFLGIDVRDSGGGRGGKTGR